MKKLSLLIVSLVLSNAAVANTIVETVDGKRWSVPEENSKAFEAEYNLAIKRQELELQVKVQNLREQIKYNACKYEYFESNESVKYPTVYVEAVCTCFAEKVMYFENNGPKDEVNAYWSLDVKYKQKQNMFAAECIKENNELKYY